MSRRDLALGQIRASRKYTIALLNNVDPEDWFRQPVEGVTHLAWQVGHLAVAAYHLSLVRVRGKQAEDANEIPDEFLKLFGKGSAPEANAGHYPDPDKIRNVYDLVHFKISEELADLPESVLDEPVDTEHPMFDTKYGALIWCAQHEFLHAGQIGLLRRLFGHDPLR